MHTERIPPREFFLRIAEQYAASNTTQSTSFATNWFRRKVVELRNTNDLPDADSMTNMGANLRSQYNVSRVVNRVVPGHMYLYEYGAESYPMRIDYYDRFPLVIVLEPYKGGILGLNLHYLNIKRRLELFVQLSTLLNNENYNFRSKFSRISYDRLKPFTNIVPKPLLLNNGKTIIENVIDFYSNHSFDKFTVSVNYKNILIKSFFKELKPTYKIKYLAIAKNIT